MREDSVELPALLGKQPQHNHFRKQVASGADPWHSVPAGEVGARGDCENGKDRRSIQLRLSITSLYVIQENGKSLGSRVSLDGVNVKKG